VANDTVKTGLTKDEAQEELISLIALGYPIIKACEMIDRSYKTYEEWRVYKPKPGDKDFNEDKFKKVEDFRAKVKSAQIMSKRGVNKPSTMDVPDFPEFCEKYMKQKLFLHQLQWFDLLEGREPRDLHPSMTYVPGKKTRLIINVPPGHAKSTTLTVNYIVWRIIKNPSIKTLIISLTQEQAKKFLLQVKERLTDTQYADLQRDFGPSGGWKEGSSSWKQNLFYVGGRNMESKDPTVQALGIGSQVYGNRADLVILDDSVDNTNVNEYVKQGSWVNGVIKSRLAPRTGRCLIIGTRMAAQDLYSEIQNPSLYTNKESPWTYLKQPAVLEFADDPKDWVTLWPYSNNPFDVDDEPSEDGTYRLWDGPTLSDVRDEAEIDEWSRMYMQEQVTSDSTFKIEAIKECIDGRSPGYIPENKMSGRAEGMKGLYVLAGLDPATVGYTACVVYGVDMQTGDRYVIDIHNQANMHPDDTRNLIKIMTEKYKIQEWRIERNAFQRFLTLDTEINRWLSGRNSRLTEHLTGDNKNDEDFGVLAMSSLFTNKMIHLPNPNNSNATKALIEQLSIWHPKPPKNMKTDLVMALWFAELRASELFTVRSKSTNYMNSPFTTKYERSQRYVSKNPMFEGIN